MDTNTTPDHTDLDTEVIDVWEVTAPHASEHGMASSAADTVAMPAMASVDPAPPGPTDDGAERSDWRAQLAAGLAAVLLVAAAVALFASRTGNSPADGAAATPPVVSDGVAATVPAVPAVGDVPAVAEEEIAPPVVAEVPDPGPADGAMPPAVPGLDVQEPPTAVTPPVPPAPEAPAPAPMLGGQLVYELDPGVDNLTVTLANEGSAPLTFSVGDGAEFSVDSPTGEIAAGGTYDLWVELAVDADGDGPTLYEVPIDVTSNGGDATIVVSGQLEKPGYLVADFADLPLVDHRGVVSFTNVGELPIEIVGLDAPGLTTAPIPDDVAPGTTWELEIAICADTTLEPDLLWSLDGQVVVRYDSWVTVETPSSESTTTVSSPGAGTPLPSCEPIIDPIDVIVLEVALP